MDTDAVRLEHSQREMYDNVRRAWSDRKVDVLSQLVEEGKRRVEEEILAQGLTPTDALMVNITVERWCKK